MTKLFLSTASLCLLFFSGCLDFGGDEDCQLTSEPLTQADLVTNSSTNQYNGAINYRKRLPLRLNFTTGSCNSPTIDANWTYTGDFEIVSQFPKSSTMEAEFVTSGTICSQLSGEGGVSEKICNEIVVNRKNVWETATEGFPGSASSQPVVFSLNGDVYSGFGGSTENDNTWYKFDTLNWEWQEKANITGPVDFSAFGGFAIDGNGYLVGNNSKVYKYNPTSDQWSEIGDFPVNIAEAFNFGGLVIYNYNVPIVSESVDGKGYFGMGLSKRLWEYDPSSNQWTEKATFPETPSWTSQVFSYKNKIYYGQYYYDIPTDQWIKNNINFDLDFGYSLAMVEFDGLMYGSRSGKTITFDGNTITEIANAGTSTFVGRGAVTGEIAIFPMPILTNVAMDIVIYYVRQ